VVLAAAVDIAELAVGIGGLLAQGSFQVVDLGAVQLLVVDLFVGLARCDGSVGERPQPHAEIHASGGAVQRGAQARLAADEA
jgi:hypothetical protein